jgi:hypothetical protein
MKEREKQMNLIQILTDYTNYDWELDDNGTIATWVEDGQSLGVVAWLDSETNDGTIIVSNQIASDYLYIRKYEYHLLAIATEYAQMADIAMPDNVGNIEQFRAYAVAWEMLGGDFGFSGSSEGVSLMVGDPWVWVEWNGERYDLFQDGCHRYAATKDGLLSAYNKLVKEVEAFAKVKAEQQLQKSQN